MTSNTRYFGKLFASLCFELCGERDMSRSLRKSGAWERCCRIYLNFYSFLCVSCTITFRGILLNIIQLSWLSVCKSNEVDNNERS